MQTVTRRTLFVLLILALLATACERDLSGVDCTSVVPLGSRSAESALNQWWSEHQKLAVVSHMEQINGSGEARLFIRHECEN